MIYPNKLLNGDLIKIISPSNGIIKKNKIENLELAKEYLNSKGFKTEEDKYVRSSINGVSSDEKKRAAELNNAILNKDVKALIACSGGDFLIQILDYIKFNKIKDNIKWVQGHSDITSLLYYITTKYDIATIYSFNIKTFGDKDIPKDMLDNNISFLENNPIIQKEYGYKLGKEKTNINWECITQFKPIKGRIIGGCLDSLKDLVGTKYDNTKKFIEKYKNDGIVWYFDVAEMTNEDILRTIWQLKQIGWFKFCKGIIFGRLYEEINYTGISLKEAINYNLKDFNIPIIINADIGHTDPVITIVNGSIVEINYNNKYEVETKFE